MLGPLTARRPATEMAAGQIMAPNQIQYPSLASAKWSSLSVHSPTRFHIFFSSDIHGITTGRHHTEKVTFGYFTDHLRGSPGSLFVLSSRENQAPTPTNRCLDYSPHHLPPSSPLFTMRSYLACLAGAALFIATGLSRFSA